MQISMIDSGHYKATNIAGDQRTPVKKIWRKNCGQQVSGTAGGRGSSSTRQRQTELKSFLSHEGP